MRRCVCGNHDDGGDAWGHKCSRRCSRRCSVSMKRARFHVTGLLNEAVPGVIISSGGLDSEGVKFVWSHR